MIFQTNLCELGALACNFPIAALVSRKGQAFKTAFSSNGRVSNADYLVASLQEDRITQFSLVNSRPTWRITDMRHATYLFARFAVIQLARTLLCRSNMKNELKHFEAIVIGTGPAGGTIATRVAKTGHSVALVDSREFGGTCALRGCNPKKVYANAAAIADQVRRSNGYLTRLGDVRLDWSLLLATKRSFTDPVIESKRSDFQHQGIKTFQGQASFVSPSSIDVNGMTLSADRFVVATGSSPVHLGIDGEELAINSDDFFELESVPQHVTFIGGGYIAMEFAHVVARHGSRVTIIESENLPLGGFEPEIVKQLMERSREIGIEFVTDAKVISIRTNPDGQFVVSHKQSNRQQNVLTGLVIHAAGLKPNLASLNLAKANVQHDEGGIKVNTHLQSVSNAAIFAAGDCASTSMPSLTSAASLQADTVTENLFSENKLKELPRPPIGKAVFTSPCLSQVGLTEAVARKKHAKLVVKQGDSSTWGTVRKTAIKCAGYKILIDGATDKIIGAHLLGPAAEEIVGLFTLAMTHEITASQMKETLFAYPTFSSDISRMLSS